MRSLLLLLILCLPLGLAKAQTASAPYQLSGSFNVLSNSFNGLPGYTQPLLGWSVSAAFPPWHNLRFVLDYTSFQGSNAGAPEHAQFPTGGVQYSHLLGRESIFAKALLGEGWMNTNWAANTKAIGTLGTITTYAGGGIDTPLSRHFSLRFEGGMQYTNLAFETSTTSQFPFYKIPGIPDEFARVSTGLVWAPKLASPTEDEIHPAMTPRTLPASEIAVEYGASFGHSHVEAGSWWSYLHVAGVEYDRHSWGNFIGARLDYAAQILPVMLLRQPAVEDEYGDPLSHNYTTNPGLGISPVGLRMLWRDGKIVKPFFTTKGGVVVYRQKALSPDGAYLNFTLEETLGLEVRLTQRWELRSAAGELHFSDARQVPSNPGLDEMMYSVGLSYHLHQSGATE
jgi:hypothetical protein